MATLGIRGDVPVQDALSGISTPLVNLTGAWQPQVDDVLLIIHGNNYYAFTNMDTPTVNGLTAGVNFIPEASVDAATNHAHIKLYWYHVTVSGDVTVTAPENGTADEEKVLTVYVLTGVDTSAPIEDASVVSSTASATTHVLPDNSTAGPGRLLVVHDHSGAGSTTTSYTPPGAPYVELYDQLLAPFLSFTGGVEQLGATVGPIGTRTITPATGVEFAATAIVLRPSTAGPANVTLVPARIRPRALPLQPVPGPVSVTLVSARLRLAALPLLAVPQPVAVTLVPARLSLRAGTLSVQPGVVSVTLLPARLTLRALPLEIPPVAVVQLVPAILRLVAVVIARPVATTPLPGGLNGEVIVVPLAGKASLVPTHDVASEALLVDTRAREL